MKKLLLLTLAVVLPVVGNAQAKMNFRNTQWGYSLEDVKKTEKDAVEFHKATDMLLRKDKIGNHSVAVVFTFYNDKLFAGSYIFTEDINNNNDAIDLFLEFKAMLEDKYGQPTDDTPTWKNPLYMNDTDSYGLAVKIGHVSFNTSWVDKNQDTIIFITLSGKDFAPKLIIQYASISLYKEKMDNDQSSILDKL